MKPGNQDGLGLGHDVAVRRIYGREAELFRGPRLEPDEDGLHRQRLAVGKPEALERDAGFDRPSALVDPSGAVPDQVVARVHVALDVHDAVALDAERIEHQGIAVLVVVERVQEEKDHVVLHDGVALADGGLDLRRFRVPTAEREIEIVRIVGDVGFRPLGRLFPVVRLEGLEGVEPGSGRPDGVVEPAVEGRRAPGRGQVDRSEGYGGLSTRGSRGGRPGDKDGQQHGRGRERKGHLSQHGLLFHHQ